MKRYALCFALLQVTLAAAQPQKPRSIFDEDWQPPNRPESAQPAPTPAPLPADSAVPVNPAPNISTPEVSPPRNVRRPVPRPADQAAVRKLMKEVYADQLKDTTPTGRQKLTKALLEQAEKLEAGASTDQFVLLTAAVDAGVGASNLPMAFAAADRLAQSFDVDGLGVKADAAARFRSLVPANAAANARAAIELARELEMDDDLVTAIKVCTAAVSAAASFPELRAQLNARIRELTAARETSDRLAQDRQTLKTAPNDPAANLTVGRHECFIRRRWEIGLRMLAKGSDPALSQAAKADLAAGQSPSADTATQLGELWYELAAKQPKPAMRAMQLRAAEWYTYAADKSVGLEKLRLEKKLEPIELANPLRARPTIHAWKTGDPSDAPILAKDQGLCVLTRIGGNFAGGGEHGQVLIDDDGNWLAKLRSQQSSVSFKYASFKATPDCMYRSRVTFHKWKVGEPKAKMIHRNEGFCVLAGVGGHFAGGGEQVQISIGDDGYWYLSGKSGQNSLSAVAMAIKFPDPKLICLAPREVAWKMSDAPVKLISEDAGLVGLTFLSGKLRGAAEEAGLRLGDDGVWYLDGQSGYKKDLEVRALVLKYP